MSFLFGSRSNKTFKPKKNIPEGTHQYDLMRHAAATLGSGNLRLAVMLPEGEDLNEWVAVNTVDFFNQINMLYGTVTEFCTEEACAVMSAGPKYEYHWADGLAVKKPIKCSAPKYIDYLMTWAQDQLDDETLFPSKIGVPFPKNFLGIAKTILKRLFRVYAHIYHAHFPRVVALGEEAHLNTSFKHFIFFVQEFALIERRELAPLQELIDKLTARDARKLAQKYVEAYHWLPMTTAIHKISIHGQQIIQQSTLPVGLLSEQAGESRNKCWRRDRKHHSRKDSRIHTMQDLFHRALESSDPVVSSIRLMKRQKHLKRLPLPAAVRLMLKPYEQALEQDDSRHIDGGNPSEACVENEKLEHVSTLTNENSVLTDDIE